jgi:hypothetical protein
MVLKHLIACCFALALSSAAALAQETCTRPVPPTIPAQVGSTQVADLDAYKAARDRFTQTADVYRACLDRDIERRMQTMMRTNAEMDPALPRLGLEHQSISTERADVYAQFVRLCLSWEATQRRTYPGNCTQTEPMLDANASFR